MVDDGWLAAQLQKDGALAPEGLEAAQTRQIVQGGDLAHNLLEVGAVDESAVLRAISIAHRTRYVTAEKLAKARIPEAVLGLIPEPVATMHQLLPIQYDATSRTLSVVLADPKPEVIAAARGSAGAAEVRAYVALPESVEAGIRRFYRGDVTAFASLEARSARRTAEVQAQSARTDSREISTLPPTAPSSAAASPSVTAVPAPTLGPTAEFWRETTQPIPMPIEPSRTTTAELRVKPAPETWGVPIEAYLETLKVLVSVSEMGMASWRQGHAAEVARSARRVASRIGLSERELHELTLAAYLHDIGKPEEPHLTLLGIATVPDQRALAERVVSTPAKLLEGAQLPPAVLQTLGSIYERADGQGLPRRRRGRDIPLGARILALVDAYTELTLNPFGAAGGNVADRDAAIATLRRHVEVLFDGNLVEILHQVISGDDLRQRLLGERARVLIADPDAEATSVLELKLVAEGMEVRVARTSNEALRAMAQWTPDLVVSEVGLGAVDGFALLEESRRHKRTMQVPFFFVSERAAAADLDRGFALGAVDYLAKPYAVDVLLVKVRRLVQDRARAREAASGRRVVGSLAEMAAGDVVEVLAKGRKTGALRLRGGAGAGDLWLDAGKIVHAAWPPDTAGQEALWKLLRLRDGEFTFDAGAPAPTRSIDAPTEWLLLEGMRRLDEGS